MADDKGEVIEDAKNYWSHTGYSAGGVIRKSARMVSAISAK